jgi:peptidoglycan/LPS O-acetylase OafA/YrhL
MGYFFMSNNTLELNNNFTDKFLIMRAVLCLIVFGTHIPKQLWNFSVGSISFNLAFLFSGHIAVVIFMILSGYLIGKQFLTKKYELTFHGLKKYYKARIKRIVPIYYISILFGVLVLGNNIWANNNFGTKLIQSFLFFYNVDSSPSFVNSFWSLSVEVQFYLFAPLIFWILHRVVFSKYILVQEFSKKKSLHHLTRFALLSFCIFSFDLLIRKYLVPITYVSQIRHFLLHLSYLIFGLSINFVQPLITESTKWFDVRKKVFGFWTLFGLMLIVLICQNYTSIMQRKDSFDGFIFIYLVSFAIGCMIILGDTINSIKTKFNQTNNSLTGLLEKLGLISYPFYLIHLIVIKSLPIQTPFFILISLGVSLIISYLLEVLSRKIFY